MQLQLALQKERDLRACDYRPAVRSNTEIGTVRVRVFAQRLRLDVNAFLYVTNVTH
jgi:hypothetical protein